MQKDVYLFEPHDRLNERIQMSAMNRKGKGRTSLMKGINKALDTNPGTSLETDTSLPHATANSRARDNVSSDVCNAEISSTNFCGCVQ
jgi:hypothetical protein